MTFLVPTLRNPPAAPPTTMTTTIHPQKPSIRDPRPRRSTRDSHPGKDKHPRSERCFAFRKEHPEIGQEKAKNQVSRAPPWLTSSRKPPIGKPVRRTLSDVSRPSSPRPLYLSRKTTFSPSAPSRTPPPLPPKKKEKPPNNPSANVPPIDSRPSYPIPVFANISPSSTSPLPPYSQGKIPLLALSPSL